MFTAAMVRTLKGAPLSVLMALMLAGRAVSAEWLADTTGYTEKPVESALRFLTENGFASRNGRCAWQITAGVMQLPLMAQELPETVEDAQPAVVEGQTGNIPVCDPLVVVVVNPESSKELESTTTSKPEKLRFEENLAECDVWGIHEPARSKLARMGHVTAGMIRAHCKNCKNLGQAIYRIEHNWKMPAEEAGPVVVEPVGLEEEIEGDGQAEEWWMNLAARLGEKIPRVEYINFVPREAPAGQVGGALVVQVANMMAEEVILRHFGRDELGRLVQEISQGMVKSLRFVTQWS